VNWITNKYTKGIKVTNEEICFRERRKSQESMSD